MDPVTTICVILVIFGTGQTNAYLKQEIYNHGDNAAVLIENITTDGKKSLEIVFSGFTKKQDDIHMILIGQKTNNQSEIQVSRHYYGRIKDVNMNNGSLKFILLNVNFVDSGNYTVSEGSLQKGKRRLFVTRRILTGQVSKPMILPFICNYTNTSSIKIRTSRAFDYVYDMTHKNCTNTKVTQDYKDRNFSCVLNDANFDLTFTELTWQDKGAYIAWDDQGLLLDALFLGIKDTNTSSPPGTSTPDSSSHKGEHDSSISSPRGTQSPDSSSHEVENAYLKPEIYNHGDNATVLFEKLQTDGIKSLEIVFSGFTKRLHVVHVIILGPNLNNEDYIQVNQHYIGRIKDINMNNGSLSIILLNVNFMDSGNYTVFEGSLVKGKRGILVTRRHLTGHGSKPMILPFVCNNTNTSSIKIGHSSFFDYVNYIIYDVGFNNCTYTNVSQNFMGRIGSCVLNDTNFNLIIMELTWRDKGTYTAWDDQGLLLDSIFVGIAEYENVYYIDGRLIWLLVSAVVNVLLLSCLASIAVRKLQHRKGQKTKEEITCSKPDQSMFQATNTALQSDDDDERTYEEPQRNDMELTAYVEPISQPVKVYQQLHPYGNQGNNMYCSLRPDNII